MVTIENLRERREAREIEDLKSEINILKGQLSKEREKLEEKEKKGMKDSDRKLIERELVNLEKQVSKINPFSILFEIVFGRLTRCDT